MPESPSITRNARTPVVRHIRLVGALLLAFAATGGAQTPVLKGLTTAQVSPLCGRRVRLIKGPAVKTLATVVGAPRPRSGIHDKPK